MILADKTIRQYIDTGKINVNPHPLQAQYQPASLDLRIGKETYHPKTDTYDDSVEIEPGQFKLGHTLEHITLPNDIAALVAGRSSVGRKGLLIHTVAGWIDPGFSGQITLELANVGDKVISFDEGKRVGQIVFFPLDQESDGYDGQYQNQTGATI